MKSLREAALLLLLAAIPALLTLWLHPKRPSFTAGPSAPEVSWSDVAQWSAPVLWVDARPSEAYERGHIPPAISLNESEWEKGLPSLLAAWRPGMTLVVYCDPHACDASQAVAARIQRELHLPAVYVLKDDWALWRRVQR